MSLEGLRAWIGEVERKLGKRTRVFLALAVIAIGVAGASVYLAIDARESSVSERDVQELQRELEAQIDAAAAGAGTPALPIEPEAEAVPDAEPKPAPDAETAPDGKGGGGASGSGATGGIEGPSSDGASSDVPDGAAGNAKVQELLQQAKAQNAEAEAETDGK